MTPKYGPAILGEEEFKRQQEAAAKGAGKYGPAVTGTEPLYGPSVEEPKPATTVNLADLTVAEVRSALSKNPRLVDELIDLEEARETPRVTVFRALLDAENSREGGPRPSMTKRIEDLIAD